MKTAIIACKTLEDEVNQAIENTGIDYPLYWIESGLHNHPDKLREELQQAINSIEDFDYILLLFGLCGNALVGLQSDKATLVIPRVDDCISFFLGGNKSRKKLEEKATAYYLTKGWLRYENNIWKEYLWCIDRYGLERTRSIFATMFKNYTHLVVIDTGAYDTSSFIGETKKIADELGLELKIIPASLELLTAALNGSWNKNFAMIEPGRPVTFNELTNFKMA